MDTVPGTGAPAIQPPQTIDEWKEQDWFDNIRWVTAMYNQPLISTPMLGAQGIDPYYNINTRFVSQYIYFQRYINGWQYNTDFEWAAKDDYNNQTKIPMWRGLDINKIFNYSSGRMEEMLAPIPKVLCATGITEGVLSKKQIHFDIIKRLADNQAFAQQMQELNGIQVEIGEDLDLSDKQALRKYFMDFREETELAYRNMAKDFIHKNNALRKWLKAYEYMFVGGRAITSIEAVNGRVYLKVEEPEYAIIDMTKNDDQHENDAFCGSLRPYTVEEITTFWKAKGEPFSTDEIKDLEILAQNTGNSQIPYNTGWANMTWYSSYYGVPKIWVSDVEWRSGTYVDGVFTECIRKGTLIGNKYLRGVGIKPKSVLDKKDKRRKMLKMRVCTPHTMLGTNIGVIGLVHKVQDIKDMLITQMIGTDARALGRIPYIDSSQLPEGMRSPEMLSMMKQAGILVGNRAELENNPDVKNKVVEVIDMTLDPNVQLYLNQAIYFDNMLADILNMPNQVRVGTPGYQSENQIQTTMRNSDVGVQWLYGSFIEFVKQNLEYAVDLRKTVGISEDFDNICLQIGDSAAIMLSNKEVQDLLDNDYVLSFDFDNDLTPQVKATLEQMAIQSAQQNPNAQLDYLKVVKTQTLDEAIDYYELQKKKREAMEAAQREKELAAAQQNAMINAEAQQNMTAMQTDAKLEGDRMKQETELAKTFNQQQP